METLREFVAPKTFNPISYVAVIFWILCGVILLGIFGDIENSDFRCVAESDKVDLVRGRCSEQYEKQYNKSGLPVYGFVIINFFGIGLVFMIYSQVVKSKVDLQLAANRRRDVERQNNAENPPTGSGLIVAYFCQLLTRLTFGIIFIVLQTQLLYPANFPSDFHCQIKRGSDAANASSAGNTTKYDMYECHNQRATRKTFWTKAVSVLNGVFAFLIVTEIIWILSRARKGRTFLQDSQFVKDHLPNQAPRQVGPSPDVEEPEPQISSEPQRGRPISVMQEEPEPQISSEPQRPLSVLMKETEPQLPSEFIRRLKESVRKGTEKPSDLKALFQEPHGEGKRNKDLELDEIYTKLELIPNRAVHDFSGDREKQLKVYPPSKETAKLISRENIFDGENKKILVVGRPGIGKTLFLTKWIRDWASDEAFNNFEFVFFLRFRKFNSQEKPLSLRDLLSRSEYSVTERLSDQVWSHVLSNAQKVLIVFDGLDEYSYRSIIANESFCDSVEKPMLLSALFYNIVEGNLLPGASVLTTTRPTAVSNVTKLSFRKTIEILGFASEQIEEYVKNFAKDALENVKDAEKKIWEHIKTNMNIFSLCYIPVNCLIICSCLLQVLKFHGEKGLTGVGLPTKLTEIYQRCVKLFFFRHDEYSEDPRQEEIDSKRLPLEVEEKIKPLTKLAFDGLTQKRLIFGQKEIPENLVNCALFHRLPDSKPDPFTNEAQYCFIHLTMQEFLAAKHIIETMKGEELRAFVADHIKNGEWQLVLQFVAGLLGEQSIDIFTDLLPKTTEKKDESQLMLDGSLKGRTVTWWPTHSEKGLALTLMKCIQETNESGSVVQSKLQEIGFNAVDFSKCRLAPADCTAVVHFIKRVQQISLIDLSRNNIGSLGCVEIVKLFDNTNCQLRGLNLMLNSIGVEGVKQLSNVIVNSQLSSLNLAGNNITDQGVKQLSNVIVNSQLSGLNLGYNDITDQGVKQLSNVLENSQLSSLNLMGIKITDQGVKQLSNVLVNSQLSSLNLRGNKITDQGVKQLSNVLENSQLSSLDLAENDITDQGVKQLSNVLVNNNKLRRLYLGGNRKITNEAREQIRQANPNCNVYFV